MSSDLKVIMIILAVGAALAFASGYVTSRPQFFRFECAGIAPMDLRTDGGGFATHRFRDAQGRRVYPPNDCKITEL